MELKYLGYTQELEDYRQAQGLASFDVGRIIAEHKERYVVKNREGEYEGELLGNLRFTAQSRADFPAVGDWVAISAYDTDKVLIHAIYPRHTLLERQAVGKKGEKQIIATNIDYAFIVQAVDRDFNLNRIERYLSLCHTAGAEPIIVLNKTDLRSKEEIDALVLSVRERVHQLPVWAISNANHSGIAELKQSLQKGKTYCMLGSSGVGKSSLINSLSGMQSMHTDHISEASQRGRHVTTHRELLLLENGSILIDNPGMREVGMTDAEGADHTFDSILELAVNCKFSDCSHTTETGCAVIAAVQEGTLDEQAYLNFLRMEREKEHFTATVAEKRKKDKDFGKMIKTFKKNTKQ